MSIRRPSPSQGLGLVGPLGRRAAGQAALSFVALVAAATLGGCAYLGAPRKLTLSPAELQNLLQTRFPQEQRLLDLFEVRASSPQLRLLPDQNRLQMGLDLQARERILQSQFKGRLDFDAALRWQPSDHTVRLDQVRVQGFALDAPVPGGLPAASPRRTSTERVAAALAERVLEGLVLYRLPAEKAAQLDQAGVQPAALAVTHNGLEITFVTKPK